MKKSSITTWLQLIYCVCCVMVVICMSLYTICYDTAFGDTLFKIGAIMNLLCALTPIGIICGVWNLLKYISMDKNGEANGKLLTWVVVGPILTTLAWIFSIVFFVVCSGGV